MTAKIRQAQRKPHQKFFLDPLVGLGGLIIWTIFRVLPLRASAAVGGVFGRFAGIISVGRNHIAMTNLRIAFPEKTDNECRQILRHMWHHWGRFMGELPHSKKVLKQASFSGVEYVRDAFAVGNGGFMCSAHLGNWELPVDKQVAPDFWMNPVYRPANNPWLDKLMFQRREGTLIPKGTMGARIMIDLLKKGQFISILCDQKLNEGIDIPFFGRPAKTATGMAALSLKYKSAIVMGKSIRQPNGRYQVTIFPPLVSPNTGSFEKDVYEIMLQINRMYEEWIRENPEQWLWIHRRFDKSIYR